MRFVRFSPPDPAASGSREILSGLIRGDAVVALEGDFAGAYRLTGRSWPLAEVRLRTPVQPSKIVALGTNFRDHAVEMGKPVPAEPKIFLKAPSALIGPEEPILLPAVEGKIEHEAELAVVIGRTAHRVPVEQAMQHVLGYCCFNDVTARTLQRLDGVFARAKGFDTFAPCGPWIETEGRWQDFVVEAWVNGQRRQRGALADLIFSVPEALAFISRVMTLLPGDVISMGTPEGVGPLVAGDEVEVRVEGIGSLINPVLAEPPLETREEQRDANEQEKLA